MAKNFDSAQAKTVSKQHRAILAELTSAKPTEAAMHDEVVQAANAMAEMMLTQMLRDIPVDEINREKHGFRIKTLQDHGYHTIADLAKAPAKSIAAISGISDDAAVQIKQVVRNIAATAKKTVRIRLSQDNKTAQMSRLILALSKYRHSKLHFDKYIELYDAYGADINKALEDLKPAASSLRWLFTGREKKEKAIVAYEYLTGLLKGEYREQVGKHLEIVRKAKLITAPNAWKDFVKNPVAYANLLERLCPTLAGSDDTVYGLPEELAKSIGDQPLDLTGMTCELRRYQEWGVKYILHQRRVLLGDEMGLGKTVQAIASMVSLRNEGATHFVVVCPASVLANWCREIDKMSDLNPVKVHGADRDRALARWVSEGGVAVTTYETTDSVRLPDKFIYSMMVVDEAHYIKNPQAKRTINVTKWGYHAERLLYMTGTALENRVEEMVTLIRTLQPTVADSVRGMEFMATAPEFCIKVAPVYYRRRREDVLTELPEKTETREWCIMTKPEEEVYEKAILEGRYADARRVSWNVGDMTQSSKAARLKEIVDEATSEGRKVIVFSFFLDTIETVMKHLGDVCIGPINGSISPARRQELVDEFNNAPAGAVLASQIQAGGTGLNIQSASVVVLCEPQFKPSIENQAVSRAYRMGQTRNVLVYRLLCEDTVDEKIIAMLESKQAVFDAFADQSVVAAQSSEIDKNGFGEIIKGEIKRIKEKHRTDETPDESETQKKQVIIN